MLTLDCACGQSVKHPGGEGGVAYCGGCHRRYAVKAGVLAPAPDRQAENHKPPVVKRAARPRAGGVQVTEREYRRLKAQAERGKAR